MDDVLDAHESPHISNPVSTYSQIKKNIFKVIKFS